MRTVVVGGGVAGLATAWHLVHGPPDDPTVSDHDVTVFEAGPRTGGKLETRTLAGHPYDLGAEAFLARRPEAERLARRLGLGEDLAEPAAAGVHLWIGGELRRMPGRTVFGVPTDVEALAASGIVSEQTLAVVASEADRPRAALHRDASVGGALRPRFGDEVVDRLVEPLLGGVYAGSVDRLGLRETTPMLADVAAQDGPMTPGLRRWLADRAADDRPVFRTLTGGTGALTDRLADAVDVRTEVAAVALEQDGGRWVVHTTEGPEVADHVVLAVPAQVAAELLSPHAPVSTRWLRAIPYATAVVIATAWPTSAGQLPRGGSGVLVPRDQGRLIKAATWSSGKWAHVADRFDGPVVRFSVGRVDDRRGLELDDRILSELVLDEGREALGLTGEPTDVVVRRWVDGLPQYDVGHRKRVAAIRQGLPDGVHVVGAAYDGVGIAPIVAATEQLADELRRSDAHAR